jgi:AsmA protein
MRRLAVFLTGLVVFAGGTLTAVYLLASANSLTTHIAESIERSTGRTVTIGSAARLRLWPEFGISFSDVKLSNPAGIKESVFAEVETMRVNIGLGALLGRRAEIGEIKLINPTVNLIIDAQGRGNWETGRTDQVPEAVASTTVLPIYVEGGTVSFVDERSGEAYVFKRLDLVLTLPSLEGAIDIKGSGDWRQDRVSFSLFLKSPQLFANEGTPIDLNVSGSWLNFAFSGQAAASKSFQLAGTVEGGTRSLRGLMRWAGVKIGDGKGLGVLQAKGALSLKGRTVSISKGQFTLDGMRAQGDVAVRFAEDKPKLTARLGLDALDLNQYAPAPHQSSDEGEGLEAWSSAGIDFSPLNAVDVSANLRAARLIYGRALMSDAVINATIADGILNAKLDKVDVYGGTAQGQMVLNGKQKVPTLQASFHGDGLDGYRLLRNIGNFTWLDGRCDFALAFAATGRSQREMIASLRGTAGFAFDDGTIKDVNLAEIADAVSKDILTGWIVEATAETKFRQIRAEFAIADGIAESKELTIDGPGVKLTGKGLVDLLKQELDFKVDADVITAKGVNVAGFAVPVVVKGPWGKPKFYPDIAGVLENPHAAYATLKTLLRTKLAGEGAPSTGENAGGDAEELLNGGKDSDAEGHADLLKKQINSDGIDLMNGFAGEGTPEIIPSEQ